MDPYTILRLKSLKSALANVVSFVDDYKKVASCERADDAAGHDVNRCQAEDYLEYIRGSAEHALRQEEFYSKHLDM